MTYAPTDRLQQAVSFGQSRKRTYRTNSQKDYVQPTKFVLRTDGFMLRAILLGATPYELSWFRSTSQAMDVPDNFTVFDFRY